MRHVEKPLDISIRISRIGKRDEERLYSDENQETGCRELVARKGGQVGIVTNERNVSGGKAARSREVERLVRRVESGESAGIVVYDFSRLTREEPWAAMMLVGRVHQAGGVVYGVADNYDSSAPMAAAITAVYAEQAHNYIKTARERSIVARASARERGAYTSRTPMGYERASDGSLAKGQYADLVPEIFRLKLQRESYAEIVRYLKSHGVSITVGGVRKVLSNPVYIGKSDSGDSPVLVDTESFERVQRMHHRRKPTGTGAKTLTQGLARCANCGSTLIAYVNGVLYCRGQKLDGCDARACVTAKLLDDFVAEQFVAAFDEIGPMATAWKDEQALGEAQQARDVAAFELEEIKSSTELVSTLGLKGYEEIVAGAAAKLDLADEALSIAKENADSLGGVASLIERWGELSRDQQRRLLATAIDTVVVRKGRAPIAQKCTIIFKGGVVTGHPDDAIARLDLV